MTDVTDARAQALGHAQAAASRACDALADLEDNLRLLGADVTAADVRAAWLRAAAWNATLTLGMAGREPS